MCRRRALFVALMLVNAWARDIPNRSGVGDQQRMGVEISHRRLPPAINQQVAMSHDDLLGAGWPEALSFGAKFTRIRGPAEVFCLGTECRQSRWLRPPMTTRSPEA